MKNENKKIFDVIIIGAGSSGLMCAKTTSNKGLSTCVIDMGNKAGRKILISGGGRCNFTNTNISEKNYHGEQPNFINYALKLFSPKDMLNYVKKKNIPIYEKEQGRYFCKNSSSDILTALLSDCKKSGTEFLLNTKIDDVNYKDQEYELLSNKKIIATGKNLVIATGGISYPKLGVSNLADIIAKKFRIKTTKKYPVLNGFLTKDFCELSGISVFASISINNEIISGDILFSHRGISGPATFNASIYMPTKEIYFNFLPNINLSDYLINEKTTNKQLKTTLNKYLPKRFCEFLSGELSDKKISEISNSDLLELADKIQSYKLKAQLDGFDYAEATKGGVDCKYVNPETMESTQEKLYFIGECLDIVGDLGGYNLQWAFSSGYTCGQNIEKKENEK